jgi:glyoxylase-like metal-dependent hydrolase (beta-lactamase superfamily II)
MPTRDYWFRISSRLRAFASGVLIHGGADRVATLVLRVLLVALTLSGPARAADELRPQKVADGVYAFVGDGGEISVENHGLVANSGFVIGASGVTVIDTGTSYRHGRRMLDAIATVTDRPVKLVILTHALQEFIFGAGAFADRAIPVLSHEQTAELMKARCTHCLENLRPVLGDELQGTRLVLPDARVSAGTAIESGGRRLELLHFGWASTPGDLAVLDPATGTVFAGGLVSVGRIPEIRDCDFEGWLGALEQLAAFPIKRVVPGHGPVSGPEAIGLTATYLRRLDDSVAALYARSTSLLESVDAAALPEYSTWSLYPAAHRRNALHRYLQLETRDLGGDPRSTAMPQR